MKVKFSDVGETVMDYLEEYVASINIRLGLLELGGKTHKRLD